MPILDLSDEELQGFISICATGSGPGINWLLTNALLTKAQAAAKMAQGKGGLVPGAAKLARAGKDGLSVRVEPPSTLPLEN